MVLVIVDMILDVLVDGGYEIRNGVCHARYSKNQLSYRLIIWRIEPLSSHTAPIYRCQSKSP